VQSEQVSLDQLVWPLTLAGTTLTDVLADRPATFSWQELVQGRPASNAQLRHFIEIQPVLDFSALEPGRKSTNAIRSAAIDLSLGERSERASISPDGCRWMTISSRSSAKARYANLDRGWRRADPVVAGTSFVGVSLQRWSSALMVGLAATAALGLAMVGSVNLICRLLHVVRRARRRFRNPVSVATGPSATTIPTCTRRFEVAPARRAFRSGWLRPPPRRRSFRSCRPATRPVGARADRRLRHADRFFLQHHAGPAMLTILSRRANRALSGSPNWRRSMIFCSGSDRDRRRNLHCGS